MRIERPLSQLEPDASLCPIVIVGPVSEEVVYRFIYENYVRVQVAFCKGGFTTSIEPERGKTTHPVAAVDRCDHEPRLVGEIWHSPVPEPGIADQNASFFCIPPDRRCHFPACFMQVFFYLDIISIYLLRFQMGAGPEFDTSVGFCYLVQGNIDNDFGWRVRDIQVWPELSRIDMYRLELAARQVGVAGVAIVEDPFAQQGFRDLDHIGVRHNVAKDVRGEGGRLLLDVSPNEVMGRRRGVHDLLYVFGHPLTDKVEVFVRDHCIEDDVALRSNGIEGLFQVRVGERFGCVFFRCDGDFHVYSLPAELDRAIKKGIV